jgi:Ser/Thr protein kinase RdoA (MazF antagonist)
VTTAKNRHDEQPYYRLSPDTVIDAAESIGMISDYRVLALNSFENRVYQVGLEEAEPVVIKFYRPARWSDEQILEEHSFSQELVAADLPVVAPLAPGGHTLHEYQGYRFTAYPRRGGHPINVDDMDVLYRMGQHIGRIHAIGALRSFEHRNTLDVAGQMRSDFEFLQSHFIPEGLHEAHRSLADDVLDTVQRRLQELPETSFFRLHGDCHAGNILWRDDKPWFVDFDDCINGPAIQDIWMLLWGTRSEQERQLTEISEGYNEFNDFKTSELGWIEILRTYRIVRQAAWVARRWGDPAFPRAFTWFDTPRYWPDHILELREQLAALNEAPLAVWS